MLPLKPTFPTIIKQSLNLSLDYNRIGLEYKTLYGQSKQFSKGSIEDECKLLY